MRPRGVEERDLARLDRIGHVVDLEAGWLVALFGDLVGREQDVAPQGERVTAHAVVRHRQLPEQLRTGRLGHVENRVGHRRVFVRHVEDPSAVRRDLHGDALARIGRAAQVMIGDQSKILRNANGRQSGHWALLEATSGRLGKAPRLYERRRDRSTDPLA